MVKVRLHSTGAASRLTALLLGVESKTGAVATGAGSRCCRLLSQDAGASIRAMTPFPVSAHRTGRADFPHPALRLVSRRSTRLRVNRQRSHSVYPERAKDPLGRETPGPARRDLMPSPQKVTHAGVDVVIDRPTGGRPGAVTEVGRPSAQRAVEASPDRRPAPLIARAELCPHGAFEPSHTSRRRCGGQIRLARLPIAVLPERSWLKSCNLGRGAERTGVTGRDSGG